MTTFTFRGRDPERQHLTREAIRARESFTTSGNFYGTTLTPGYAGMLDDAELTAFWAQRKLMDYVVVSYSTPIAWHTPQNGWHIVNQKFSQSTGRQQSFLRMALAGEH